MNEHEQLDAGLQLAKCGLEGASSYYGPAVHYRVSDPPMNYLRLPRPSGRHPRWWRAPDRDDEIHGRRIWCQKLIAALGMESVSPNVISPQQLGGERLDFRARGDPSTEGVEMRSAPPYEQSLGHYAADGIVGAQEKYA